MNIVRAIFISHEHSDHISGLSVLARKYQLPVYITPDTLQFSRIPRDTFRVHDLQGYEPVWIGDLCITAFPKWHDAADPHSFLIAYGDIKVGVFTDIGAPCEHVISHFSQCHAAFLEANYDEDLLENGRYPIFLKRRIQGPQGHLSNQQALELFRKHKPSFMSHLLMSHLSKDNNSPQTDRVPIQTAHGRYSVRYCLALRRNKRVSGGCLRLFVSVLSGFISPFEPCPNKSRRLLTESGCRIGSRFQYTALTRWFAGLGAHRAWSR